MRSIVLRNKKSGYTITVTPYKEDSECWYVIETNDGDVSDTQTYPKAGFELVEEE